MLSSRHHVLRPFPTPADGGRRFPASAHPRVDARRRRVPGSGGTFLSAEEQPSLDAVASCPVPSAVDLGSIISSPSNSFVKHCVKLRRSATYRRSRGCVIVVGITPIREIFRRYRESSAGKGSDDRGHWFERLIILDGEAASGATALLEELGIGGHEDAGDGKRVVRVSSTVMKKLTGLESADSTELVAVMRIPKSFHDVCDEPGEAPSCSSSYFSSPPHRLLVLDGIQDPGNLGTLLRSAMAFKWDGIFLLPSCCDPFNDKAVRAARGASFHLTIIAGDWVHLKDLKEKFRMKMLAAHPGIMNEEQSGQSSLSLSPELAESLKSTPLCLILGSEGNGLSQQTLHSSELLHIPMVGNFESLNVAVAGGILMFAFQCQHGTEC